MSASEIRFVRQLKVSTKCYNINIWYLCI